MARMMRVHHAFISATLVWAVEIPLQWLAPARELRKAHVHVHPPPSHKLPPSPTMSTLKSLGNVKAVVTAKTAVLCTLEQRPQCSPRYGDSLSKHSLDPVQ